MSLVFHDFPDPPTNKPWRGLKGSAVIYGKRADGRLEKLPPEWTMRGYFEHHNLPVSAKYYDARADNPKAFPTDPDEQKAYTDEIFRMAPPIADGMFGRVLKIDKCLVVVYLAVHPNFEGRGCASRWLDRLPRKTTVIFPEVLPLSKMPAMLERRGFKLIWMADTTDELGIYFPCYARYAK